VTPEPDVVERLRFLARVVQRECDHLRTTDGRLFREPFTAGHARRLKDDVDLAERVDPEVLASALGSGHGAVPKLVSAAERILADIDRRGWLE